jgi:DNA-binding response OmpR family regulator
MADMKEKSVLICEDDLELSQSLVTYLEDKVAKVYTAENGEEGFSLWLNHDIDVIISDIQMPVMDGLQLLAEVKDKDPITPFILMTGFTEILATKSAYERGATDFLPKPFRMKEMSDAIREALERDLEKEVTESYDQNYVGIAIEEFELGSQIHFPIFIRLSERKYVKLSDQGEDISQERIASYREKGVDYLFLRRGDFMEFKKS